MEVIIVDHNGLCPQSPPSKAASTSDGQRSELLLPPVSKLAHGNSQNYGQSWDECLVMFEKNEGESLSSEAKTSVIEDTKADQAYLHYSYGYNPGYSVQAKQQEGNKDEVEYKGSKDVNSSVFYISQGNKTKHSSENGDQVPGEKRSSSINNRIHRSSVARQDSLPFDITLGSPNEAMHNDITENKRRDGQSTHNKTNLTQIHHRQREESRNPSDGHRQNLTKQVLPPNANLAPGTVIEKMPGKHRFYSKWFADSELVFANKTVQETCNHAGYEQASNQMQSDKNYVKSYPNDNANESKNTDSKKQSSSFDEERDALRTPQFLFYAMFFAMIVLVMMLVHLHTRVTALERNGVSSSTTRCQCDKTILALKDLVSDKRSEADNGIADSNNKDTLEQMGYIDNEIREPSADGERAKLFIEPEDNKHMQSNKKHSVFKTGQKEKKVIDRMQTGIPNRARHDKRKNIITNLSTDILNLAGSNATHQSLSTNKDNPEKVKSMHNFPHNNIRAIDTFPQTTGIQGIELTDFTMDTTGQAVSRHKRAGKPTIDKDFVERQRQQQNKEGRSATVSSEQRQCEQLQCENSLPQVDNFDVPFFDIFDFTAYFMLQDPLSKHRDCTTRHTWGHGIVACKNSKVIFPEKHSILPFYRATNATAGKDGKTRLISTDDGGRFHVNVSGDYLFQQNITLVADSEKHYLALYLNGQATLACQHGGFACPHFNDDNSSKYKVCIISGVLELRRGDVLDIRTMDSHMAVRVDKPRKPLIKFILLNRIK